MMLHDILPRRKVGTEALRATTLREFDGGWNVIDNDLNLSASFAKIMENVYRTPDGSVGVRWGTRLHSDLEVVGDDTAWPITNIDTTNTDATVNLEIVGHGLISGLSVTLAGFSGTYGGIAAGDINGVRVVTYVDADNITIEADSAASSTATIAGSAETLTNDQSTTTSQIIYQEYFGDYLVQVCENGQIYRVNASGVPELIWSSGIAGKLSGTPSGWSTGLTFASSAVFNRQLIICNGVDKPVIIDFEGTVSGTVGYCQYLYDLGNPFSNTNVPIGRYVLAMSRYTVIAGDPDNPGRLHISSRDTSGTWAGDAGSDGLFVDLGKYVSANNQTIRGIARFDDKLFVQFDEAFLIGTLGIYDSSTHTPTFDTSIAAYGGLAHNAIKSLGNDLYACDYAGVPSIARALFSGNFRPERVSELIGPEIQADIAALTVGATEDQVFAVHNRFENQYMLFIPNASSSATETKVYVYTLPLQGSKRGTWARFRGWNFRAGCRSALDRVFLSTGVKTYVYGNRNDPITSDFVAVGGDPESGTAIDFTWEFPWADFDRRMDIKQLRYIAFDAKGAAQFTLRIFVDNLYKDSSGNYTPIVEMDFVASAFVGFGGGPYGSVYGGGRSTLFEALYAIPGKFKIMKLQLTGSTTEELRFVSISIAYLRGSIRR